jgi:type IV pilus assembly PilP-like protein
MTGGLVAAMVIAVVAPASAQGTPPHRPLPGASQPAPAATAPVQPGTPPAAAGPPATAERPTGEPYSYNQEGRRDPFVSLISRGVEPTQGRRADGLSTLTTNELMLRGVLQSRGAFIALVSGPEGKTFPAHVNDRLADGVIRNISPQGIVIMQEVNDPLSLIKQREVRKGLRAPQDGKQ